MEHGFQLRWSAQLRQRHLHPRRRHARAGLPHCGDPYGQQLRRDKGLLKEKDDNLTGEDIREGLTAIISARIGEPQFEGQTKSKLGNVSMRSLVEKVTNEKMAEWLEEHPAEGKAIVTKATNAARARVAAADARKAIRSKSLLDGAGMPDKLKDCSAKSRASRTFHRRG